MNIKFYRNSLKLTQKQLADLLGLKRSTISMWEIGKSYPCSNKLNEIAILLHCTVNDLFDENISK